ncbi:S-layer family protein [Bacillus oleivorans]|uniref:Serine protease n=1 Tax=Bacillus oleivorans TaxID=1448271 RepID=A0A285CJ37_9BACI|nr:S-layer homology domain-containing protein [Bacillus oleivorans]SNX67365.1 S-layer family protein [Bacillus oleivorans]
MSKKWFYVLVSIFTLLLVNPVQAETSSVNFKDVSTFQSEITYLAENGIISGYDSETFGPNRTLTRAEAVIMIMNTFDISDYVPGENPFSDVSEGMKAFKAIQFAAENGIVNGFEDGTFRPYETLTRGQMAQILTNAYGLKGSNGKAFSDTVGHRFESAISTVAAHRFTIGYDDGSYRPNTGMKRMDFAAFLARAINPIFLPEYTPTEMTAEELSVWSERTVEVDVYKDGELLQYGTGFITESGLIATAYHVVAGGDEVYIYTEDGVEYAVEGVAFSDIDNDLALLKPEYILPYPSIPMASSEQITEFETVYSFGLPYGFPEYVQSEGNVLAIHDVEYEGKMYKLIEYNSEVVAGSSGGPIVNVYGQAIGLNSSGFEDMPTLNFSPVLDNLISADAEFKAKAWDEIEVVEISTLPLQPGFEEVKEAAEEASVETEPAA